MSNSVTNSCSTSSQSGSDQTWSNLSNIYTSDDNRVSCAFSASLQKTNRLIATGFSFTIPAGATIDGITVEVEKKASSASRMRDYEVYLTKNGSAVVGDNTKNTDYWSTTEGYVTYGSSSSLWGTTWTPAEVNASTFGVVISAQNYSYTLTAYVDHIRVTITYTATSSYSQTGAGGAVSGGSSVVKKILKLIATGGGVAGGAATFGAPIGGLLTYSQIGAGGAVGGGSATITKGRKLTMSGGGIGGGSATVSRIMKFTGSGGGLGGGSAHVRRSSNWRKDTAESDDTWTAVSAGSDDTWTAV